MMPVAVGGVRARTLIYPSSKPIKEICNTVHLHEVISNIFSKALRVRLGYLGVSSDSSAFTIVTGKPLLGDF